MNEIISTIRDDVMNMLEDHTEYIPRLSSNVEGFAKSKIKYAIAQLSELLHTLQKHIRIPLLIGGMIGLSICRTRCDMWYN
jgi:hypothetical protein